MTRHRSSLPQLSGGLFLTDGGIETTLVFLEGLDLPHFAAFDLLRRPGGEDVLRRYFRAYADLAVRFGSGLVLESATWRASADWGAKLGCDARGLAEANRRAVELLDELRCELRNAPGPVVVSGCVGPRGDGYRPGATMSADEAQRYHAEQIRVFADGPADQVTAITMNYAEEAIGIARAAERVGMPVAISFTVETDGRLPTGQALRDAIGQVEAETSGYPAYYLLNCAHPTHFASVLEEGAEWTRRIRGLRTNASRRSHAELDAATDLDAGDPVELGGEHADLVRRHPHMNVLGGCCGTDVRHVEQIATTCAPLLRAGT